MVAAVSDQKEKEDNLLDGIHYTGDKGPCFGSRHTQIVLMAIGSGIASATKTTFSIILIAMTTANTSPNPNVPIALCLPQFIDVLIATYYFNKIMSRHFSLEPHELDSDDRLLFIKDNNISNVYDWSNKGVIVGAILWSGIPIQVLTGYLGKRWGPKWLTLGANIINAIFFMLIPLFANIMGAGGVIFCRLIQGAAQGGLGPLGAVINGIWAPPEERSKAGLIGVIGTVGIVMVASVVSGVIGASYMGWPWFFYIMGIAELLWCVLWFFFAHQSPQSHPRITPEEKKYIEVTLIQQKNQDIPTPWKKILTSIHFWAVVVAALGTDWTATMLGTEIPIFLARVLEMDIKSSGTILAVAPIVGIVSGIVFAPLSDFLIKRNIIRCVNARRLFHSIGSIGNGINLILMTFLSPGSTGLVIMNLCVGNIFILMYSVGGSAVNVLDISPAFAGIISGVASTLSQAFALFAPLSLDWIIYEETSAAEWRTVFIITAVIALVTSIFFVIFATDKRQEDWEVTEDQEKKKIFLFSR